MSKCSISDDGKIVTACEDLASACEYGNPTGKRKGVWAWTLYSMSRTTSKGPVRQFFGIKSGKFVEKGFAFNFCPFCGTRIDSPLNTP